MSEQVSALKMVLHTSSNSSSTSGSIARYDRGDAVSSASDATSTASDFSFPTPVPSSVAYSSFNPDALQMIVQDLSVTEISGQFGFPCQNAHYYYSFTTKQLLISNICQPPDIKFVFLLS